MITVKRLKKKSKLPDLKKKLLALHDQKTKIGYFKDSGTHTLANMSYASLAFIHEFPVAGYHPTRPVIGQIKPMKGDGKQSKFFKDLLNKYIQFKTTFTLEDVLETVGKSYTQKAHHVFGNTALLVVTNNPTPLVDTGELESNIGYRTTINMTLRKG